MAIAFNETTVVAQPIDAGVMRQKLLTAERVKNTNVLLDRFTLAAGATVRFTPSAKSLAWLQMLEGDATLTAVAVDHLSDSHSVFLPPGFGVKLTTRKGATLLYAEIPDAGRIDPGFSTNPPRFMVVDWAREPVFESESDARKRIFLVTAEISGTKAMRAEMVIYPPGSVAPNYYHQGTDSLMYVVSGSGTAWANEQPLAVRQGDLIHFPDGERHHLSAASSGEMRFLVFDVPGEFKTVWADQSKISAWGSTGRDIHGHETAEDERERIVYSKIYGNPWIR